MGQEYFSIASGQTQELVFLVAYARAYTTDLKCVNARQDSLVCM